MNNHHEKWMSTIIWVVLLGALVYTSISAWQTTATTSILNPNNPVWQNLRDNPDEDIRLIDWLSLLFSGGLGLFIILSWLRFADISLDIFKAYAKGETPFKRMLIYPLEYVEDNDEDELNPDEADNSLPGGLLRTLGFAWAMIILIPPVLSILSKLLA